ncbi:unnamed protein product [Protopolystoma xenopodis]|uniref:Uncharacterized protein n=1 Tax=Protopolystoma xenopodis TaxID=117903 RepID=A0A3S5AR50_9PLAT|nr:unnamed protein product [Protopolystoma xenopodis]
MITPLHYDLSLIGQNPWFQSAFFRRSTRHTRRPNVHSSARIRNIKFVSVPSLLHADKSSGHNRVLAVRFCWPQGRLELHCDGKPSSSRPSSLLFEPPRCIRQFPPDLDLTESYLCHIWRFGIPWQPAKFIRRHRDRSKKHASF